jgi:hypothetical protein
LSTRGLELLLQALLVETRKLADIGIPDRRGLDIPANLCQQLRGFNLALLRLHLRSQARLVEWWMTRLHARDLEELLVSVVRHSDCHAAG